MSAIIIDGKAIARDIRQSVAEQCQELRRGGIQPALAVILVGENPASEVYVRNKERACKNCCIRSQVVRMPDTATQAELIAEIHRINGDPGIHGLLLQLPLPKQLNEAEALAAIDWRKDVDGFSAFNAGALMLNRPAIAACTPAGCMELLKRSKVPLAGADAVVIGRSNIVGKPMALMLLGEHCTVTLCHSRTRDLKSVVRRADIVVAALGRPRFVTADMVKPGAAVIDVGINRMPDGSLAGDVDFDAVQEIAGWITPVPGGVGPMTIAMLMVNALEVARRHGA